MPRSRSECIADHIAKTILRNTRKRWRTLHADALQEIQLSDNLGTTGNIPAGLTRKGSPADGKSLPGSTSADSVTSGMNVQTGDVAVTVKPTDSKTLAGSYAGDHRVKAAPSVLPQNPGPRESMTQAPFGKNTPSNLPVESYPGNVADSDAGN
jgi:hypothetical protein